MDEDFIKNLATLWSEFLTDERGDYPVNKDKKQEEWYCGNPTFCEFMNWLLFKKYGTH